MRFTATNVARLSGLSVCDGYTGMLCKNGRTDMCSSTADFHLGPGNHKMY